MSGGLFCYFAQSAAIWFADIVFADEKLLSRHFEVPRWDFWHLKCNNCKYVRLIMVYVLLQETAIHSPASLNENSDYVIACFLRISFNSRDHTEVTRSMFWSMFSECRDGIITNSINLVLSLTLVFDSCKTKQIYLIHDNRARKSRTTLQNKVLPEQLTLFANTSVTFKKCIIQ